MVVQWLRFYSSCAGGMSLIPGWGTKIPGSGQKKKKKFNESSSIRKLNKREMTDSLNILGR